jgi:serine protease Do
MRRPLLTASLAALSLAAIAQPTLTPEQLFEQGSPSVWVVHTLDGERRPLMQGSAVVIGPGQVLTNCHVLRGARSVSIGRENMSFGATLEHPDTERDLCLLKVANLHAPAVSVASHEGLRVGARVYAIGAPQGMETTLSDGLLSGIRRSAQGEVVALQISVPISPGSSGGGLFDTQGRLVGVTSAGLREAQNLNFALPAGWIAEVPARAQAALAANTKPVASPPKTEVRAAADRVFEYRLIDRLTGLTQSVVYRLDRESGGARIFNQGDRVEREGGAVVSMRTAIGGEFDLAMPPGGWINAAPAMDSAWRLNYEVTRGNTSLRMDLRARVLDVVGLRVGERDVEAIRVEFKGFTSRPAMNGFVHGAYKAQAWYAPKMERIVRFEARSQGGNGGAFFNIDEQIELVDIRSE